MSEQDLILGQQIARLEGSVSEGFKGIHSRLDDLNHKTAEHEKKFIEAELVKAKDEGEKAGIQISWARFIGVVTLISLILGIITVVLPHLFKK